MDELSLASLLEFAEHIGHKVYNLYPAQDWTALLTALAVTYGTTYFFHTLYHAFINPRYKRKVHIRLAAIVAGMLAAVVVWPSTGAMGMKWYGAALVLGWLSIMLYHALSWALRRLPGSHITYPLATGGERRESKRPVNGQKKG